VVGNTVWLDRDAAGHGWFVDPTPADDAEFPAAKGDPAFGRMDLLTVVTHEVGRLLGLGAGDAATYPVMAEVLPPGVRRADRPRPAGETAAGPGSVTTAAVSGDPVAPVAADGLGLIGTPDAAVGPPPALLDRSRSSTTVVPVTNDAGPAVQALEPKTVVATYEQRPAEATAEDQFDPLQIGE
jgi:hypothetical protein